jgi:hypothetical protein
MVEGVCTYCGKISPLSYDHVPPRCIFARPRPPLITVPSCHSCNQRFSPDDEYLRLILVSRHDTAIHPDGEGVWEAAMRGLGRPTHLGLAKRFLRGAKEVNLRSPAGLYLGRVGVFEPDIERIRSVAIRIVRGLYFHHYKLRIPDDYTYSAYPLEAVAPTASAIAALSGVINILKTTERNIVGRGAFAYRHQRDCSLPFLSAWLLEFYEKLPCLVTVFPRRDSPPAMSTEPSYKAPPRDH